MNKADRNEQDDTDVLQCKADVLRARDIIPPYDKKKQKGANSQKKGENKIKSSPDSRQESTESEKTGHEGASSVPVKRVVHERVVPLPTSGDNDIDVATTRQLEQGPPSQNDVQETRQKRAASEKEKPTEPAKKQHGQNEIPQFDLAEEIMAEQRRISAIRRKAPGTKVVPEKREQETKPVGRTTGQPQPIKPDQEKIIAEIVARDIESLCRSDMSGIGGEKQRGTK